MNIYVYSDESGVFDKKHNDFFVYGGIVIFTTENHENWKRKYKKAEQTIRKIEKLDKDTEVKATNISNKSKNKLFRSLNKIEKFGGIIYQPKVLDNIFENKKSKQRYLDYIFKICVKRKFEDLINKDILNPENVENIYFFADEHSTATNGKYELTEGLEQEFKFGTNNWNYSKFFPPIFPSMSSISLDYCNSQRKILIRSADIIANKLLYSAKKKIIPDLQKDNFIITTFPNN